MKDLTGAWCSSALRASAKADSYFRQLSQSLSRSSSAGFKTRLPVQLLVLSSYRVGFGGCYIDRSKVGSGMMGVMQDGLQAGEQQ